MPKLPTKTRTLTFTVQLTEEADKCVDTFEKSQLDARSALVEEFLLDNFSPEYVRVSRTWKKLRTGRLSARALYKIE